MTSLDTFQAKMKHASKFPLPLTSHIPLPSMKLNDGLDGVVRVSCTDRFKVHAGSGCVPQNPPESRNP